MHTPLQALTESNYDSHIQPAETQTHQLHLICDDQCTVNSTVTNWARPTGAEILAAAGRPANAEQIILQVLRTGGLENIRLDEQAELAAGDKFVLTTGDQTFRFTVNSKQFQWPHRFISGAMLRELATVPHNQEVELLRHDLAVPVAPTDLIDLSDSGVEKFATYVKAQTWKLKVQGVILEYETPEIKVADAMTRAGFDPMKAWHIYLIVQGQPKQEVSVEFIVDLRTHGIEKIRLMQRNVDNGDGQSSAPRRQFKMLPVDEQYMNALCLRWETVFEGERRWVLIHDYTLPAGYAPQGVLLALDIPKDYPASQIDMFYFTPFVTFASGSEIPSTQVRVTIGGVTFQGWSRHRNAASIWDPNCDSVRTHMALIESCLSKELGE